MDSDQLLRFGCSNYDSDEDDDLTFNEAPLDGAQEESSTEVQVREMDVDEILIQTGQCGRFQVLITVMMGILAFSHSFVILSFYFMAHSPEWECKSNFTATDSLPHKNQSSGFCNQNAHKGKIFKNDNDARCHMDRNAWKYHYNKTTLLMEYDLVCDRSWLDALIGSVIFIGWGLGALFWGRCSDAYGRKKVMYPCMFFLLVFALLQAFITSPWQLVVLRFLCGFFLQAPALNSFILIAEFAGPDRRVFLTTLSSIGWTAGLFLMTLKGYLIDSWRTLTILCSAPYFIVLLTALAVPESVRWLNTSGRRMKAEMILRKIAKTNKSPLDQSVRLKAALHEEKKASYIDLFRKLDRAKLVLFQAFMWFTCGLCYYGLTYGADDFGLDMYVSFMLSVAVEMPAGLLAMFMQKKLGRKKTGLISFSLTAVCCVMYTVVASLNKFSSANIIKECFGVLGKAAAAINFSTMYLWSAELYPTVVRTQGMGINIIASRAGSGSSLPVIILLKKVSPRLPLVIFGVAALISVLFCSMLPETKGRPTRESLDDFEYKRQEMIDMAGLSVTFSNASDWGPDAIQEERSASNININI